MSYIRLYRSEWQIMTFGFMLPFFSSFGQTFLVSLYVPGIMETFSLSNSEFGLIYSLATLLSGTCLLYLGKMIDSKDVVNFTYWVGLGMVVSCLVLGFSNSVLMLFVGIFGLRLSGQGLMGHISMTVMARYFDKVRGKAVSFAGLGYSAGEAVFPIIITSSILFIGWRMTLISSGVAVLLLFTSLVYFILKNKREAVNRVYESKKVAIDVQEDNTGLSYRRLFKDKRFWLIGPSVFFFSCLVTALFFFQIPLALSKGWSPQWMAICVSVFAISSSFAIIGAGILIDRFSATRIFPYHLIAFALGALLMVLTNAHYIGLFYMALLGISAGIGASVKSAIYAELYGTKNLGKIRSFYTAVMVLGTALGPFLYGALLDLGLGYSDLLVLTSILTLIVIAFSFKLKSYKA